MFGFGKPKQPMPTQGTSFGGFGKPPATMNQGIGPSNPLMSKMGMMAGGMMGGQRPQPLPEQPPPPMMAPPSEPIGDAGIGQNLNPNPVEAPIPQMGLGPRPQMMPRRPMMNRPQFRGRM